MIFLRYGLLCLVLATTGCASGLKTWTEQELSPYLVKELTQHPTFKNEPIILVDIKGEQVESKIDQLTASIRDQMFNTLLENKGVNLIWQASTQGLQHHQRLQDLQCDATQKARFYIGFDLKAIPNNEYEFSVKALDPIEGRWVDGFGKTWQGRLSADEIKQLDIYQTDDILRGLRPLPFTEQQMDLLANYLAKNVSCLLQQSTTDNIIIYAENNKRQGAFMENTLALIVHYLSRFNTVQVVSNPDIANISLRLQSHKIDQALHQMWLVIEDKQTHENVRGMDTVAYVNLSPEAFLVENTQSIQLKPILANPVLSKPLPVIQKSPQIATAISSAPIRLFNTLDVIIPQGKAFCYTTTPWIMGDNVILQNEAIPYCFGLKMQVNQEATVFLINENSQQHFIRLTPENGSNTFILSANQLLRYPKKELFELEAHVRAEKIHVIAVNNPQVAAALEKLIKHIPICCDTTEVMINNDWKQALATLQQQHNDKIDWQILSLQH